MVNNPAKARATSSHPSKQQRSIAPQNRLESVQQEAYQLMEKHGLVQQGWRFRFDHARMRAGQCRYDTKTISISRQFAEQAPPPEVTDTLLHEIAHALTPRRGHDQVWKQVALAIGCSGERCHSVKFSTPKYRQHCIRGCWTREVHRRRKNLVCRFCKGSVVYSLNESRTY